MSNIIIRESQSMRFKPHFNSAMGKYIHTKDDYLKEMKKGNFQPYDKNMKDNPDRKKPTLKQDTKEMISYIRRHTDKNGGVQLTSSFIDALEKKKKGFGKALINPKKYIAEDRVLREGGFH